MSDTPKTDSMRGFHGLDTAVNAEFSEQLERELNEANQRIKRLESVEKSHADVLKAIDNWMQQHKAKEAKP